MCSASTHTTFTTALLVLVVPSLSKTLAFFTPVTSVKTPQQYFALVSSGMRLVRSEKTHSKQLHLSANVLLLSVNVLSQNGEVIGSFIGQFAFFWIEAQ